MSVELRARPSRRRPCRPSIDAFNLSHSFNGASLKHLGKRKNEKFSKNFFLSRIPHTTPPSTRPWRAARTNANRADSGFERRSMPTAASRTRTMFRRARRSRDPVAPMHGTPIASVIWLPRTNGIPFFSHFSRSFLGIVLSVTGPAKPPQSSLWPLNTCRCLASLTMSERPIEYSGWMSVHDASISIRLWRSSSQRPSMPSRLITKCSRRSSASPQNRPPRGNSAKILLTVRRFRVGFSSERR